MYDFNYHRPASLQEAKNLFDKSEDGWYLAGGHTLIPSMKQRLAAPSDLIDLSGIEALSNIDLTNDQVRIGALATHDTVARSGEIARVIPALCQLASGIGDAQVRNCGTIGGSIANNDPAADYPAALVGLNASVQTDGREIAADDFFTAMFETALEDGELIQSVTFPIPKQAAYVKFPNPASRYATVGVMVTRTTDDSIRVAITGAAPCVFRCREMEKALSSQFDVSALDNIALDAGEMNNDLHASAEYRAHLCVVMAAKAVEQMQAASN